MLEKVKESWEIILGLVVMFNIIMGFLHDILGAVKNYTATKVDNKIWKFIGKLMSAMQKSIDRSVANKEHK